MKLKNKLNFLQKILSYFFSFSLEKSDNPYYLELILDRNKLVLNSQNANQSNQNLKSAFNQFFHRQEIYNKEYDHVLILGLGLGSVVDLLLEKSKVKQFTAYENEMRVVSWIEKYYHLENLEIIPSSAEDFKIEKGKYDLIIVDLFQDDKIPEYLSKKIFWDKLKSSLTEDGILIWNTLTKNEIPMDFSYPEIFSTIDPFSYSENLFFIYSKEIIPFID